MGVPPHTLVGLLFLPLAWVSRGRASRVQGVLEIHGGWIRLLLEKAVLLPGGADAITLGHVVLGRCPRCLERTRAHERVHVRQCERWGPFFLPAYVWASAWALVRGRRPYEDNRFEREARAAG